MVCSALRLIRVVVTLSAPMCRVALSVRVLSEPTDIRHCTQKKYCTLLGMGTLTFSWFRWRNSLISRSNILPSRTSSNARETCAGLSQPKLIHSPIVRA